MEKFSLYDIKRFYEDVLSTEKIRNLLESWTFGKILLMESVFRINDKEVFMSKDSYDIKIKVFGVIKTDYRNYTFIDARGVQYEPYYKNYNYIFDDEEGYLNYLKEKEKNKKKYLDIDPFNEENWDY
jgi:hypothetical protein